MPAKLVECPRCMGRGYIRAFSNVAGGVCFLCGGTGKIEARSSRGEALDIDMLLAPPSSEPLNDRKRATPAEARAAGKRALDDAAYWFKVALDPKIFYTYWSGPATPEQVAESYYNAGVAVGRSVVDRDLFERALARARTIVPPEMQHQFAWGVRNGVTHADGMHLGIDRRIPPPPGGTLRGMTGAWSPAWSR